MKLRFTAKADAITRRADRSLNPTTVMLRADGRVFQSLDDPMGDDSTCRLVEVTDLFDVEAVQEFSLVLTEDELNALRRAVVWGIEHAAGCGNALDARKWDAARGAFARAVPVEVTKEKPSTTHG